MVLIAGKCLQQFVCPTIIVGQKYARLADSHIFRRKILFQSLVQLLVRFGARTTSKNHLEQASLHCYMRVLFAFTAFHLVTQTLMIQPDEKPWTVLFRRFH